MTDFREYQELYHYGIKGMRWGIRRYQNPDGTLTDEGRRRYHLDTDSANQEYLREKEKINKKVGRGVVASMGAGYASMLGGLGAAAAMGSGTAAAIAGIAGGIGGPIAGIAAAVAFSKIGNKKIDILRKSYGEDRIKRMERFSKNVSNHLTARDIQIKARLSQINPVVGQQFPVRDWHHIIEKGIKNGDIKIGDFEKDPQSAALKIDIKDLITKYGYDKKSRPLTIV